MGVTVSELIEELKKYPPDQEVVIDIAGAKTDRYSLRAIYGVDEVTPPHGDTMTVIFTDSGYPFSEN